jgi:predicted NAD/FAD-binding protein
MKVAIVGSGIAGLTVAHKLHPNHDITVFEAGPYAGGHTHTVRVELDGHTHDIDTGFIVFNELHYPNFTRLLRELGVATQTTSMSFSVRHDPSGLEYSSASPSHLFAQRRNLLRPGFHRMWFDVLRFNREAARLEHVDGDETTVAEFVERQAYSPQFLEQYLVPLGASLWSCPPGTFRSFPIRFVVDFLANHQMLQLSGQPVWRVVKGGSSRYVEALTASFRDRIRLNTPIARVQRQAVGVRLRDGQGGEGCFDHVVIACHADQALDILGNDVRPNERDVLNAFPYQPNDAILHTDASVLPRSRKVWSSWNYHIPERELAAVQVTYNMNILQSLASDTVFNVTLNEENGLDPDRILGRFRYEHPIFTRRRSAAQARHHELIGTNDTSFCGAYWGYGFHEDGVRSALEVCRHLGERRKAA